MNKEEYLNLFHSKNIFVPTKTILFSGEIGKEKFDEFIQNLHFLDSVTGEITVKLCSEGGDTGYARAMIDAIRSCKNMVTGVCYGDVESAATLVLQAFDTRIMTPNSRIMVHVGEESIASNHPRNVDSLYDSYREEERWMQDTYLARIKEKKPRFTREKVKDLLVFDKYLKPKECLALGLIDKVSGDPQ